MTDTEIAAQLAAHEAAVKALRELQQARALTAPVMAQPGSARKQPAAERRWELAARAFRRFAIEPHTVRDFARTIPRGRRSLQMAPGTSTPTCSTSSPLASS